LLLHCVASPRNGSVWRPSGDLDQRLSALEQNCGRLKADAASPAHREEPTIGGRGPAHPVTRLGALLRASLLLARFRLAHLGVMAGRFSGL
jgi:hypothetical protein